MVDEYPKTAGNLVAIEDVPEDQTSRYGILSLASDDGKLVKVNGMVENPRRVKRRRVARFWDVIFYRRKYSSNWTSKNRRKRRNPVNGRHGRNAGQSSFPRHAR